MGSFKPFTLPNTRLAQWSKSNFSLTESEKKKILFGQDVHGPIHPDLESNVDDYQRSLKLMLDLDADILCEGHYGFFSWEGECG
jgi:hypothetical protein